MNVIQIVADTFRRDHVGAYGNRQIVTPNLDDLADRGTRFDSHYAGAFPTMPARADFHTGRWTASFMNWGPLGAEVQTLAQLLTLNDVHCAAVVDTPFYIRHGMNYDRGFQTFFNIQGQAGWGLLPGEGKVEAPVSMRSNEAYDLRSWWRGEMDRNAPRTFMRAMDWLERHAKEQFYLLVDTWDPHEPWDAPHYYTELYWPDYDGEIVQPVYRSWHDVDGFTADKVEKARATYCGEITMVDTWIGYLIQKVQRLGLADNTAIVFTTDHGFYFGEHGGQFGKMTLAGGSGVDRVWTLSPLYEELVHLPLIVYVPGLGGGSHPGLTSAIDIMPTILELLECEVPEWVEGRSLLRVIEEPILSVRAYTVSTVPFANAGDEMHSVDNVKRKTESPSLTTVTSGRWSLIYSPTEGQSELYDLESDPHQSNNVIWSSQEKALELHGALVQFMEETNVPERLRLPRLELRL